MTTRNRLELSATADSGAFAYLSERAAIGVPAWAPDGEGAWSAVATRRTRFAAQLT